MEADIFPDLSPIGHFSLKLDLQQKLSEQEYEN